jgi:Zn-finger nucleic acid-binding protein
MTCPHCRAAVLVEIRASFAGSDFTMHSCPSCESRWWDRDGHPVALDRVLTTVAGG